MNLRMAILLLCITTSALSTGAVAGANNDRDQGNGPQRGKWQSMQNDNAERIQTERREREERGVQRLKQHKWQTGYVMPQHYRGDGYKVEFRDFNLPKPARNQQWYKINNDFILVDADSNSIVRIVNF